MRGWVRLIPVAGLAAFASRKASVASWSSFGAGVWIVIIAVPTWLVGAYVSWWIFTTQYP
jgi:hypothetical protein